MPRERKQPNAVVHVKRVGPDGKPRLAKIKNHPRFHVKMAPPAELLAIWEERRKRNASRKPEDKKRKAA